MQTFKTLMLREWLQHSKFWLKLGTWMPVFVWGGLYILIVITNRGLHNITPDIFQSNLRSALDTSIFIAALAALFGVLFNVSSLPYRDKDDKSLAFWRSLPITDRDAVLAPVLMQAIILPGMAIMLAWALSLLLSAPLWLASIWVGMGSWLLPLQLAGTALAASAAAALGLVWLLPAALLLALGNSLARRWGIFLALIGARMVLPAFEHQLLGTDLIRSYFSSQWDAVGSLLFTHHSALTALQAGLLHWGLPVGLILSALLAAGLIKQRARGQTA